MGLLQTRSGQLVCLAALNVIEGQLQNILHTPDAHEFYHQLLKIGFHLSAQLVLGDLFIQALQLIGQGTHIHPGAGDVDQHTAVVDRVGNLIVYAVEQHRHRVAGNRHHAHGTAVLSGVGIGKIEHIAQPVFHPFHQFLLQLRDPIKGVFLAGQQLIQQLRQFSGISIGRVQHLLHRGRKHAVVPHHHAAKDVHDV